MPSAKTGQSQRLPRTTSSGTGMKSGTVIITTPMSPITKPSAPMTNVCLRNSPRAAIAAMRQKRSQAWSMAKVSRTSGMASPIVSATRKTSPVSSDSLDSSIATRVTTHTVRCGSGIRSVMQRMSATTAATTTRTVAMARPGNGASSVRRKWSSGLRSAPVRVSSGSGTVAACKPVIRASRRGDPRASRG